MKKLREEYKKLFQRDKFRKSFLRGISMLVLGGIISFFALNLLDKMQLTSVNDLILDNIPTLSLFWFRTFGIFLIIILAVVIIFLKPKYLPISFKAIGLLYIIRPLFIVLTNLKAYSTKIHIPTNYFLGGILHPRNDLFFSGHVAFPFMISLIFWDNKKIRYCFILLTIISGIAVLFAKIHYSIDVFVAPFIAYGIYKISEKWFKDDLNYIKNK